jgi:hypothetical protein
MVKNTTVPMRKVSKKVLALITGQMVSSMLVNGQKASFTDMALKLFQMVESMWVSGVKEICRVMAFTRGHPVRNT